MNRNYAIDTLRTIATLMVVLLHVSSNYVEKGLSSNDYDISFLIGNIIDSFCRICVPLFVLISGRFLIGRKESIVTSFKKRVSRILVLIIVWSIIYLFYRSILEYLEYDSLNSSVLLKDVLRGSPFYHLWYLFMIIGMYLITPILNNQIEKILRKKIWFIALGFMIFGIINNIFKITGYNPIFILWFINYLGYYIIGYLMKDSSIKISPLILLLIYILSSFLIFTLTIYTVKIYHNIYFYGYLSPFVIFGSLSIYKLFCQIKMDENILSRITHLTLGIYLIHAGILDLFNLGLMKLDFHFFDNAIIGIPFKFILVSLVSIISVSIIYKVKYLRKIL
jgi:surface polysaccharide O-acyltransferase-like enzyme